MKKKKLNKTTLARKLEITPQAISMWDKEGKIPAKSCMDLEPILKIRARELFLKPSLLFDMFNNTKQSSNNASIKG